MTGKTTHDWSAQVASWTDSGPGVCTASEGALPGVLRCPTLLDPHGIDNFVMVSEVAVPSVSKEVTLKTLTFNNLGNVNTFDLSRSDATWVDVLTGEPETGPWVPGEAFSGLAVGVSAGVSAETKCETRRGATTCKTTSLPSAVKLTSVGVETAAVPDCCWLRVWERLALCAAASASDRALPDGRRAAPRSPFFVQSIGRKFRLAPSLMPLGQREVMVLVRV